MHGLWLYANTKLELMLKFKLGLFATLSKGGAGLDSFSKAFLKWDSYLGNLIVRFPMIILYELCFPGICVFSFP